MLKKEEGFTLIELLASLVILSVVLLTFSSIFTQNSKISTNNTEKLIVTNLADAYLQRLIIEGEKIPSNSNGDIEKIDTISMNNKQYEVTVTGTQNEEEKNMHMQNILVTVKAPDSTSKASVEGYVKYHETIIE